MEREIIFYVITAALANILGGFVIFLRKIGLEEVYML